MQASALGIKFHRLALHQGGGSVIVEVVACCDDHWTVPACCPTGEAIRTYSGHHKAIVCCALNDSALNDGRDADG